MIGPWSNKKNKIDRDAHKLELSSMIYLLLVMDVLLIGIIDGNPSRDSWIIITHTGSERTPMIDKPTWLSVKILPLCMRQIII